MNRRVKGLQAQLQALHTTDNGVGVSTRLCAQTAPKMWCSCANPVSVYNKGGGKMQSQLNRRGNPLDQLANRSFAPNALLSERGRNPFQTAREEMVPEGQPLYNTQHVINRTIEPLEPTVDSVGRFELALLHRKDSHKLEYTRVQEMHSTQQRPVVEVNPAQFNLQRFARSRRHSSTTRPRWPSTRS